MKHSNSVENTAKETTLIKSTEKKTLTLEKILDGIESAAEHTSNIVKHAAHDTFSNIAGEYLRQSETAALMAVLQSKTIAPERKAAALFEEAKKTQKKGAALRLAAMSDDTELLDYLIEHHSDKLEKSKNGRGLLSYAAEYASTSTVERLIGHHKFDPDETDKDSSTILHFAAKGGKNETITCLVESYQLDIEAVNNNGDFAMHFAARGGKDETLCYLSEEYGLNLKFSNNNGSTALDYAAGCGYNETIKFLIEEYEIDPFVAGKNALYLAAANGKNETIDLLVKKYNFNAKEKRDGLNLLHFAAEYGHIKTIQHLVKYYQLDPAEKTNKNKSILDIVLKAGFKNLAYPLLSQFPALRNDGEVGEKLWQSRQMRTALPHTLAQFALEKAKEGKYLRLPAEVVQRIADVTDEINFESLTDKQREQLPAPGDKALAKRCRYFNRH